MTDENKGKDEGLMAQVKAVQWKLAELQGGKEAVEIFKKSNVAYEEGHTKEALHLAWEGQKMAFGHMTDAVKHAAASVKDFVTGGEPVTTPTPAATTPAAAKPKTTTR